MPDLASEDASPPATSRWRRRAGVAVGAAVCLLGLDLASMASRILTIAAVLVVGAGLVQLIRALLFWGPRDGALYRRRKQIALLLGTSALCLLLAVSAAASIRMGPTDRLKKTMVGGLEPQGSDDEIGWAPLAPPEYVGQRLHVIDPAREQIVVLGDSILYGLNLRDEETAAHDLGEMYPGIQVVNASVSGYSIDQYYLYLRRILPRMRPKAAIIGIFSGNDFQVTGLEYSWGHSKPLFTAKDGGTATCTACSPRGTTARSSSSRSAPARARPRTSSSSTAGTSRRSARRCWPRRSAAT